MCFPSATFYFCFLTHLCRHQNFLPDWSHKGINSNNFTGVWRDNFHLVSNSVVHLQSDCWLSRRSDQFKLNGIWGHIGTATTASYCMPSLLAPNIRNCALTAVRIQGMSGRKVVIKLWWIIVWSAAVRKLRPGCFCFVLRRVWELSQSGCLVSSFPVFAAMWYTALSTTNPNFALLVFVRICRRNKMTEKLWHWWRLTGFFLIYADALWSSGGKWQCQQ